MLYLSIYLESCILIDPSIDPLNLQKISINILRTLKHFNMRSSIIITVLSGLTIVNAALAGPQGIDFGAYNAIPYAAPIGAPAGSEATPSDLYNPSAVAQAAASQATKGPLVGSAAAISPALLGALIGSLKGFLNGLFHG
jgi:hypothetical protein